MDRIVLHVEGMTCGHCAQTVTQAVQKLRGISKVGVDLEKKEVSVEFDGAKTGVSAISDSIGAVGFEVVKE